MAREERGPTYALLMGSTLMALGVFMPWVKVAFFTTLTVSGVQGEGKLVLIAALCIAACGLRQLLSGEMAGWIKAALAILAGASAVFMAFEFVNLSNQLSRSNQLGPIASIDVGYFVSVLGTLVAAVATYVIVRPPHSVRGIAETPQPTQSDAPAGPTQGEMTGVPGWLSDPGMPGAAWDFRPSRPTPASGFASPGPSTAVITPPQPTTAVQSANAVQQVRLHFGKKARIATGAAVVLIAAVVGLNMYLSSITTAQAAAKAYEQAVAGNDASAIWPHLAVTQPTADGGTAYQPSASRLLSESDLKAMLSLPQNSHPGRSNISVGTVTRNGDSAVAQVSFQQQGQASSDTLTLVRDPSQHEFFFYPIWKVAVAPGLVSIGMPGQDSRAAIDGTQLPAGVSTAYVLPGNHRVTLLASGPYAATDVSTTVSSRSMVQATFTNFQLTPPAHISAIAAVKSFFTSCLQRTDPTVAGCPQRLNEFVSTPVTWQLIGDPTSTLAVTVPTGCQTAVASGQYLMAASYATDAGPAHRVSGGAYTVPLTWDGQAFQTQSQGLSCGAMNPPTALANPAATQSSLLAVVQAGWQACLKATVPDPPDCPANAAWFGRSNFGWTSATDPMAGAQVSWDGDIGVYKVSGNYSLVASYSVFGTTQTNPVSGSYTAYVTWDGQTGKLVNIGPGNR